MKIRTNANKSNKVFTLVLVEFRTEEAIVNGVKASSPFITIKNSNNELVNKPEEYYAVLTYMKGTSFVDKVIKFESKNEGNKFYKELKAQFSNMEIIK